MNLYVVALIRLTGIENGLLGLNSRVNAVMWAKTSDELDIDVICFGHLLFEMCAGYELTEMHPTKGHLQLDLERYPGVIEILNLIFDYPDGGYPSIEELVLHEFFRNIDLREMRGMGVSGVESFFFKSCVSYCNKNVSFQHAFTPAHNSTLLINAMRRRQGGGAGIGGVGNHTGGSNSTTSSGGGSVKGFCSGTGSGSLSEGNNSPCSSPPMTPRDRKLGVLFV